MSGKVPISRGAELGNLLSKISSQNSINSFTLSCLSASSLGSDWPWSIRDDGLEEDADELGRGREGASEGRQVYMSDSRGGRGRVLDCDVGLVRADMVLGELDMNCSLRRISLRWRWGRHFVDGKSRREVI